MKKAIIMTVGGSPDPLTKTINRENPDLVIFITTQETDNIDMPIIMENTASRFRSKRVIIDNFNDIRECYEKTKEALAYLDNEKDEFNIKADITGGTKPMAGALSILANEKGFEFIYVGGRERTRKGRGYVKKGAEEFFEAENLNRLHAEILKRKVPVLINNYHYQAAADYIESEIKEIPENLHPLYECIRNICRGYNHWDNWNHQEAIRTFKKECEFTSVGSSFRLIGEDKIADFVTKTENMVNFLGELNRNSLKKKVIISDLLIKDILANAKRRMKEGNYDDAIIRLYKSLEMKAKGELFNEYGIDNSDVDPEKINDVGLRKNIIKNNHNKKEDKYKIGLYKSYTVLKSKGNRFGDKFYSKEYKYYKKNIAFNRNNSWLIHDNLTVKLENFKSLFKTTLKFLEIDESEIPGFPRLEL